MQLNGTVMIAASQEKVWEFLTDPQEVSACAPGLKSMEVIVPDEKFRGVASVGFGAVKATFEGEVEFVTLEPPNRASVKVHATAPGSAVDATSEMILSPGENGSTQLDWSAEVVIVGTIANLATRMAGGLTNKLSAIFFDCVKKKIEE